MNDLGSNTRFNFEYVLPWSYAERKNMIDKDHWGNNNVFTYILLKPNTSQTAFDAKLKNITIEHTKGNAYPSTTQVFTQALKDTWLYDKEENGNYKLMPVIKLK